MHLIILFHYFQLVVLFKINTLFYTRIFLLHGIILKGPYSLVFGAFSCTHRWRTRAVGACPESGPGTAWWYRANRALGCHSRDSPLSECWLHTSMTERGRQEIQWNFFFFSTSKINKNVSFSWGAQTFAYNCKYRALNLKRMNVASSHLCSFNANHWWNPVTYSTFYLLLLS